jgi:large subunit ribosomal protein L27
MSTKKAAGSTTLGRDSAGKRLGVKIADGDIARPGNIIIRQRGTKYHVGTNVRKGKDDTIFSMTTGVVKFTTKKKPNFQGALRTVKVVSVVKPDETKTVKPKAKAKKK